MKWQFTRAVVYMISKLKRRIKYMIPIFSFIIFAVMLLTNKEKDSLMNAIKELSPLFIIIALFLMLGYWIFEAYILFKLLDHAIRPISFFSALRITLVGQFFNGITPFSSGGQPAQLYMLRKRHIPIGTGASILTLKFIIYQIVLVLYSLFFVVIKAEFFFREIPEFAFMSVIGFVIHIVVILSLLLIVYHYKPTVRFVIGVSLLIQKRWHSKKSRKFFLKLLKHIHHFHEQIRVVRKRKISWLFLGFLSFVQLTLFFSIPLVIGYGFNLSDLSVMNMIGSAAFIAMLTAFIPIPGAALGAEGSFFLVYRIFFPAHLVLTALLIWRVFTYYLPIFVGGVVAFREGNS